MASPDEDDARSDPQPLRSSSRSSPRGVVPNEHNARIALKASARLMTPIVRWLLRHGVAYPSFAEMLKTVFVQVGQEELQRDGSRVTHSALSIVTGVHRKDVRTLTTSPPDPSNVRTLPLASQVFMRWLSDVDFLEADGKPRTLARSGPTDSFEALARRVSADVHPRSVLDELMRLGLVEIVGSDVRTTTAAFLATNDIEQAAQLFASRVGDHLGAAVHNLTEEGPKFLEQSIFIDGLGESASRELADAARASWEHGFHPLAATAQRLHDAGAGNEPLQRVRYGVYFYAEPQAPHPAAEVVPDTTSSAPLDDNPSATDPPAASEDAHAR